MNRPPGRMSGGVMSSKNPLAVRGSVPGLAVPGLAVPGLSGRFARAGCVPLVVHGHHSLLRGTAAPGRLLARAAEYGYPALALTDRDNLYGAIAFRKQARDAGLAPLTGVELTGSDAPGAPRAVLLVRTMAGYENACRLVTARTMDPAFDLAAALGAHHDGLHVLTDTPSLAEAIHPALPPHRLWLLLTGPVGGGARGAATAAWPPLLALSRRLGRGIVASPDVMWLEDGDRPLHRTLGAVRNRALVTTVPESELAPPGSALPRPAALIEAFRDVPGALVANRLIREECAAFAFTLGKPIFPKYPLPPGDTSYSFLFRRCLEGMRRRYGGLHPGAMRRLTSELEVIDRLGFPEYFVIVGDICRFAHDAGIPTVGRGSGAGSIVAYLLGITNVDPLHYRLYFERFLHEERRDLPDLDIDLCWRRRDDVIAHVYRTYGADRVAMISTHNTFQARGAFRDVARAHGVPPDTVDRWSRAVPSHTNETIAQALGLEALWQRQATAAAAPAGAPPERAPRGSTAHARAHGAHRNPRALPLDDPIVHAIVRDADRLLGAPRHLGIHCGGIVIGDRPLTAYVPLEEATKGIVVTQYEMHAIESIGLVKIDLLGNRAISVISESVRLIRERGGPVVDVSRVDPPRVGTGERGTGERGAGEHGAAPDDAPVVIPDGDPAAARLMARGDTLGVFQLESPGMRNLLRMLATSDLNGAIAALSLIRPGPAGAGMKESFVKRSRGLEPVRYLDPRLEPHLRETYGVPLYEEDVMLTAAELGGLSLMAGDMLRRAIGEIRTPADEAAVSRTFIGQAIRHGTPPPVAEAAWKQLRQFAAYAFCKAHASGYGVLAYQEAWLKAHHPAAFAVAILNNHTAMYHARVHLEDARRHGVPIRLPCVNGSAREFTLEGDGAIRIGLGRVRLLSDGAVERLLAARAARPFRGVTDLLRRVRPMQREAENLVLCGAFDFTGRVRPVLMAELYAAAGASVPAAALAATAAGGLFDDAPDFDDAPPPALGLNDFTPLQRRRYEFDILEMSAESHPMTLFDAPRAAAMATAVHGPRWIRADQLDAMRGRPVRFTGIVAAHRRVRTKSGEPMYFLSLEDEAGLVECTFFPAVYRRVGGLLTDSGPYVVDGRAEDQHGAVTINVERLRRLVGG